MNEKLNSIQKRKEMKDLNYWDAARLFASRTMYYCTKFPECFRFSITGHLVEDAREIMVLATQANKVFINTKGPPEEQITQYGGRLNLLTRILRKLYEFDVDFDLLMGAIDLEYDTLEFLKYTLSRMTVEMKNTSLKDVNVNIQYGIEGDLYYRVKDCESGCMVKSEMKKLKFSSGNKSYWLRLRNELEERVKLRMTRDRAIIKKFSEKTDRRDNNAAPFTAGGGV